MGESLAHERLIRRRLLVLLFFLLVAFSGRTTKGFSETYYHLLLSEYVTKIRLEHWTH